MKELPELENGMVDQRSLQNVFRGNCSGVRRIDGDGSIGMKYLSFVLTEVCRQLAAYMVQNRWVWEVVELSG